MSTSNVKSIDYNEIKQTLTVEYNSGAIWMYHPINMKTYYALNISKQLSEDVHKITRDTDIVGVRR